MMSEPRQLSSVKCTGPTCSRKIVWGTLEDGRKIPLDPRPAVYQIVGYQPNGDPILQRSRTALVGHHATCPDVGRFSKGANR